MTPRRRLAAARSRLARELSRPGLRAPLAPLAALLAAGAVLVVHGETSPVQQYSGVSVPVVTESGGPTSVDLPALLTLSDGAVTRVDGADRAPVALPAGAVPLSLQQVSPLASAALALLPAGVHALLLPTGGGVIDLGPADRLAPGAQGAAVAIERAGAVLRFALDGAPVGDPVTLPPGLSLAADSSLGVLASTAVGPIESSGDGIAPPAEQIAADTRTALQSGALWLPVGPYQPLAVSGAVALLWDPLTQGLGLLDLRRLAVLEPVPADRLPGQPAPSATPDGGTPPAPAPTAGTTSAPAPSAAAPTVSLQPAAYPALRGVTITGPAAFSRDGRWVAIAAQVGDRPRLIVGPALPSIVRGETELDALSVISLGGALPVGAPQPRPVWSGSDVIAARVDGSVAVYSTLSGVAVGQPLQPGPASPQSRQQSQSAQPTGPIPIEVDPTAAPSDAAPSGPSAEPGSGSGAAPVIAGLGIG